MTDVAELLYDGPEVSDDEELIGELLLEAEEARSDIKKFVEFVMRSEKNAPIKLVPHQRVVLDFVEAHYKAVVLLPRGHSKTFLAAALILWTLGHNPLARIGLFGAAQDGPKNTMVMVRDYIELSDELHLVFPDLARGKRAADKWTDTEIVVDRPFGIRHPSVQAFGIDSQIIRGKRLDLALIDDCLSEENTATKEMREQVHRKVQGKVRPTVDPQTGKMLFLGTAFFNDDTVHQHAKLDSEKGWPSLVMRIDGTIQVRHADEWDSDDIVPADARPPEDPRAEYRLKSHEPDPDKRIVLWPEMFSEELIEEIKEELHPIEFARNYMNLCRDDATSLCKQEYIDKCLEMGRLMRLERMWPAEAGEVAERFEHVFVGVDTAFAETDAADECAIFVLGILPDPGFKPWGVDTKTAGTRVPVIKRRPNPIRVPVWIEHGHWGTDELAQRLLSIDARYHPRAFAFENNGAQEGVRKLLVTYERTLVLKPHTTNATKSNIRLGVPSLFGEFANAAWAFPNRKGKPVERQLQTFIDQGLAYDPKAHTGDVLMAAYFARDLAKKWGALARGERDGGGNAAASIKAR